MSADRPHPTVYAAVFVTSAAAIATQIAFTRVFSIALWHHFAYLVVGIALLGFGVAGSHLTRRGGALLPEDGPIEHALAVRSMIAALATALATALGGVVRCNPLELLVDWSTWVSLAFLVVLCALPFYGVGLVFGTALSAYRNRAGSLYAADLLGAGIGGASSTLTLAAFGAPGVLFASAAAMAFAALLLARRTSAAVRWRAGALGAALLCAFAFRGDDDSWIAAAPGKEINYYHLPYYGMRNIEHRAWTAHGRIDVSGELKLPIGMGGEFGTAKDTIRPTHYITQDGAAPTELIDLRSQRPEELDFMGHATAAAVWVARDDQRIESDGQPRTRPHSGAKVLVIGVGGGVDLIMALAHGAARVTGAEINPEMLALLQRHYTEFSGQLAADPRVELVNAEGRAFVRSSPDKYDVIQLSGVDTFAALASGAYSVAEAYLYTAEAFDDYLDHLTPTGCVQFSRWYLEPPRETIRVANTFADAMRRRGDDEPWRRILVLRGDKWASIVACNQRLDRGAIDRVRDFAKREGYTLAFAPLLPGHPAYLKLLRGTPEERERFLDEHPYRVDPASDEVPFFFNYYKWDQLLALGSLDRGQMLYAPDLPIGHAVLLATFVVTSILGLLGILGPLWRLRDQLAAVGTAPVLIYFAGLGVAYLFVEIGLLQRLTFFLGHPTYALSVVLSALLVSSGAGAWVSSRVAAHARLWRVYPLVLAAVVAGGGLVSWFVVPELIGLSFTERVGVSLALVAPLGFAMGIPFPTGLERLRELAPALVPWAFGVNAFFTVIASALAPILSMAIGLSALLFVAAAIYPVAFAVLRRGLDRR